VFSLLVFSWLVQSSQRQPMACSKGRLFRRLLCLLLRVAFVCVGRLYRSGVLTGFKVWQIRGARYPQPHGFGLSLCLSLCVL
jgi:hypothetical protein